MTVLIQMEKVEKAYQLGKQTVPALRGIDLSIAKGDFLAVVGPSGSGKTTLLNLLALIDEPSQGTVRFGGKPVGSMSDDELTEFRNQHVGIIFQTFNLVPVLSAVENVALALQIRGAGLAESEKAAAAELARVGLADFGHHRPDELSGGQRQRVAIARALVTKPDILIADEPTASLDGKTALEIVTLMRDLNAQTQMTFVFSTHDTRLLDHVGGRLELVDGRVVRREGQVAA